MLARLTALAIGGIVSMAVAARAGTPFGGDDAGFVPPDGSAKRCAERVLLRALAKGKLFSCDMKCHRQAAREGLKSRPFDETTCEANCRLKYDLASYPASCPTCLDASGRSAIADTIETFADGENGALYCAGTIPFGDDDAGFVPPDLPTAKCEEKVLRNLVKVVSCLRICHFKSARQGFRGEPFDDEPCETGCLAQYAANRDKTLAKGGCPSCLDAAGQDAVADDGESFADSINGPIFCASPGGAFLD